MEARRAVGVRHPPAHGADRDQPDRVGQARRHVELGYFGDSFGRPSDEPRPWLDDDAEIDEDMWAKPDESRDDIVEFFKAAWAHADDTVNAKPLDASAIAQARRCDGPHD